MIILHFHLQPQFKNELFHILHIPSSLDCFSVTEKLYKNSFPARCSLHDNFLAIPIMFLYVHLKNRSFLSLQTVPPPAFPYFAIEAASHTIEGPDIEPYATYRFEVCCCFSPVCRRSAGPSAYTEVVSPEKGKFIVIKINFCPFGK